MSSPGRARSVIVVGGGPAGCTAATLLARAGIEVTLIEQSRFPRDKVCGECLSDLALATLEHNDLLDPLRALSPQRLSHARLAAGGSEVRLALPATMRGLTRQAMDAALLKAARSAAVQVRQPARVVRLVPGNPPSVELRDLVCNVTASLTVDVVILADGKGAMPDGKPKPTGDLGLKAHFRGVNSDPDTIALFGVHGHYTGLAPVSDGTGVVWNVACSIPAARVRQFGGDHQALLAAMRRENSALDTALEGAQRIGPWLASPLPRFAVQRDWPPGILPIGNAAAALEPIGGEGMGLAIASAALAADGILEGGATAEMASRLRRQFNQLWRTRRAACRSAAVLLSQPSLGAAAVRLARLAPPLARLGLRLAGKDRASGRGSFVSCRPRVIVGA